MNRRRMAFEVWLNVVAPLLILLAFLGALALAQWVAPEDGTIQIVHQSPATHPTRTAEP